MVDAADAPDLLFNQVQKDRHWTWRGLGSERPLTRAYGMYQRRWPPGLQPGPTAVL